MDRPDLRLGAEQDAAPLERLGDAATPSGAAEEDGGRGMTRLGPWGEVVLGCAMVMAVLYLFTFSHSNAGFREQLQMTPGTSWAQPRQEARNWLAQHTLYAEKIEKDEPELIFYGDSITELFRGTMHMEPDPRALGVPEVWHRHFGQMYRAAALGIAGDRTAQLMWRLKHGEAPRGSTKAAVVLIGTNDLTQASFQRKHVFPMGDAGIPAAGNTTARHILAIAEQLHSAAPDMRLLLLGLLPRGDQTLMPDPAMFEQPNKFSAAIAYVNSRLRTWAAGSGYASFLDCGAAFLADSGEVDIGRMPDALHPNAEGMEALCRCLTPAVQELMGH